MIGLHTCVIAPDDNKPLEWEQPLKWGQAEMFDGSGSATIP
jgi:hypothetical protein